MATQPAVALKTFSSRSITNNFAASDALGDDDEEEADDEAFRLRFFSNRKRIHSNLGGGRVKKMMQVKATATRGISNFGGALPMMGFSIYQNTKMLRRNAVMTSIEVMHVLNMVKREGSA
eukprot:jgi/Bigna1/146819/aug1.121_g21527